MFLKEQGDNDDHNSYPNFGLRNNNLAPFETETKDAKSYSSGKLNCKF